MERNLLGLRSWNLKTGGATGPLPPPPLFIRYLRRSAQSEARQRAHLLRTIFDFGFWMPFFAFARRWLDGGLPKIRSCQDAAAFKMERAQHPGKRSRCCRHGW